MDPGYRAIKFVDLRLGGGDNVHIVEAVNNVLHSGRFIKGHYNAMFEDAWAKQCGVDRCIPTSSGTAALVTALKYAHIVRHRMTVIVPTYTFAATALAVREAGLNLIYCDVTENGLLDQDACLELLGLYTEDVCVVVPVHLYGQVIDIRQEILDRAIVIEDACQAHGMIDVQGDAACFSFYPTKNLGAAGDAGALVTSDPALSGWAEAYVNYGDRNGCKYDHNIEGNNLRMDEIQAAVLCSRLGAEELSKGNTHRERVAMEGYFAKAVKSFCKHLCYWHLYPVLVEEPEHFIAMFKAAGVETARHYPYTAYDKVQGWVYRDGSVSTSNDYEGSVNASFLANHVLSLPIGPHVTIDDAHYIATVMKSEAWYDTDKKYWILREAD